MARARSGKGRGAGKATRSGTKRPKTAKPAAAKRTPAVLRPAEPAPAVPEPAAVATERTVAITVNGRRHDFLVPRDLAPETTLAYLLRERLGFSGLKVSCDEGACGACTVLLDGKAVLSCMMLAVEAHGHEVTTIEGLPQDDPVIQAFAAQSEPGYGTALQCGYCTPGFVMASVALLRENPRPSLAEVKEALSGNLCRCGCYAGIARAVLHAAEKLAARGGTP
ncbi:MAG: (2Fe-2S)-binding protein [Deltaproteobacteria bacterium]|nr:(2Fe-2S)-binding protein [Deltaproteobacteria bacterium]